MCVGRKPLNASPLLNRDLLLIKIGRGSRDNPFCYPDTPSGSIDFLHDCSPRASANSKSRHDASGPRHRGERDRSSQTPRITLWVECYPINSLMTQCDDFGFWWCSPKRFGPSGKVTQAALSAGWVLSNRLHV